jgi:DNA-binding transcriptional MerR regulator
MKTRLFNEYESYTKEGYRLSDELHLALEPIIKKWADLGFSVKDIESIMYDDVSMISDSERTHRISRSR